MNFRGESSYRQDNTEKVTTYIRDSENSMLYSPNDTTGNRFMGTWNKLLNLQNMVYYEDKEKYLNEYQARFQAKLEIGSLPKCFNNCVKEVGVVSGLSSDEKNCVRECYFKRVTSRDDMNLLF